MHQSIVIDHPSPQVTQFRKSFLNKFLADIDKISREDEQSRERRARRSNNDSILNLKPILSYKEVKEKNREAKILTGFPSSPAKPSPILKQNVTLSPITKTQHEKFDIGLIEPRPIISSSTLGFMAARRSQYTMLGTTENDEVDVTRSKIDTDVSTTPSLNKVNKLITEIESRALSHIAKDEVCKVASNLGNHDPTRSIFSETKDNSPLLPLKPTDYHVLSTEKLRTTDPVDHQKITEVQEENELMNRRREIIKATELEKLNSSEYYSYRIKLDLGAQMDFGWSYNVFVSALTEDCKGLHVCFEGIHLNDEGELILHEESNSTKFNPVDYFEWKKDPRELLNSQFRITIEANVPCTSDRTDVEHFKIADSLFMYNSYTRIELIRNMEVNDQDQSNLAVYKRISMRSFDNLQTLKNNIEAFKDWRPKPKVKLCTVKPRNRYFSSSELEDQVIIFMFRKLSQRICTEELSPIRSPRIPTQATTMPMDISPRKFNHIYYEFNTQKKVTTFESISHFIPSGSASPRLYGCRYADICAPNSRYQSVDFSKDVQSDQTLHPPETMIITRVGKKHDSPAAISDSVTTCQLQNNTRSRIDRMDKTINQSPLRIDLPIEMNIDVKPLRAKRRYPTSRSYMTSRSDTKTFKSKAAFDS